MRVSFAWLKDYVDIRTSPEALAQKLTMAGLEITSLTRVEQDAIMEIEVTPNRTDCLSIIGIAREVAAITAKKLKIPKILSFRGKSRLGLPIQIQDKKLCPRYLGRIIKNVAVGSSPEWLIQRLEAMGIRAVNNIADITNFCLLEFGQPLHAFDLAKLEGQRIIVRRAKEGEHIITIDGVKRDLDRSTLVIADKFRPQALAGIMGSKGSEVSAETKDIFLESAYFNPLNIHNTSRKLGLATQSSYRFERGVDFEGVYLACCRATELIQKLARAGSKRSKTVTIGRLIDKGIKTGQRNRVRLRYAAVKEALGVEISPAQIKEFLRRLQFSIVRRAKERLVLDIPSFRHQDISREADLIEEIARLYGYDKIPLNVSRLVPSLSYAGGLTLSSEEIYNTVRQILSSSGFSEIMSYSLISRQALRKSECSCDDTITVTNPLSYEQEILRPTLLVGMLNTLLTNINRKNMNLKLFELSRVYHKTDTSARPAEKGAGGPCSAPVQGGQTTEEFTNLCIGMAGEESDNWLRKSGQFSFFDLKGTVEALLKKLGLQDFRFSEAQLPFFISGRSACVFLGEENYGFLGELKRETLERFDISCPVYAAELKLHKLLPYICEEKKFVPLARFPSIERDISLVAPQEVHSGQIVSLINKVGRGLIAKVTLFDQYFGEQIPQGFRGLSFSVEYRSIERTLTAEEVDKLHGQVRKVLSEELKVQIR